MMDRKCAYCGEAVELEEVECPNCFADLPKQGPAPGGEPNHFQDAQRFFQGEVTDDEPVPTATSDLKVSCLIIGGIFLFCFLVGLAFAAM